MLLNWLLEEDFYYFFENGCFIAGSVKYEKKNNLYAPIKIIRSYY